MAGKKKKKPAYHPTKYNWTALEIDFLSGDEPSVKKFCTLRGISKRAYERKTVGWGLKRMGILAQGNKIVARGLSRDYAEQMKTHLNWGQGPIKIAIDALVGDPEKGIKPLVPKTAAEATRMLYLGTLIQRNAIVASAQIESLMKEKGIIPSDQEAEAPKRIVSVIIDLPSNGKEAPDQ